MDRVSEFSLVGQLLGFVIKDGYKIKYLRMSYGEREYWIKISKEMRGSLDPNIQPGCWLEIMGTRTDSLKNGKMKLKADSINITSPGESSVTPVASTSAKKCPGSILICKKSTCQKKGGKIVSQLLKESLRHHGLEDQVNIKETGCLKKCKLGPNLVMLPDKARYTQVKAEQIPALVAKHFSRSEA